MSKEAMMRGQEMKTVIEMVHQAADPDKVDPWRGGDDGFWVLTPEELERFADIVRADERARMAAQQEPVAWMHEWEDGERIPLMYPQDARNDDKPKSVRPLVFGDHGGRSVGRNQ